MMMMMRVRGQNELVYVKMMMRKTYIKLTFILCSSIFYLLVVPFVDKMIKMMIQWSVFAIVGKGKRVLSNF